MPPVRQDALWCLCAHSCKDTLNARGGGGGTLLRDCAQDMTMSHPVLQSFLLDTMQGERTWACEPSRRQPSPSPNAPASNTQPLAPRSQSRLERDPPHFARANTGAHSPAALRPCKDRVVSGFARLSAMAEGAVRGGGIGGSGG